MGSGYTSTINELVNVGLVCSSVEYGVMYKNECILLYCRTQSIQSKF